jgi:hypothetical protein
MIRDIAKIRRANPQLASTMEATGGFLNTHTLPQIIAVDRLMLVLVRCGNGRFLCPAQDVEHFTNIITKEGSDYVRDWSLPA